MPAPPRNRRCAMTSRRGSEARHRHHRARPRFLQGRDLRDHAGRRGHHRQDDQRRHFLAALGQHGFRAPPGVPGRQWPVSQGLGVGAVVHQASDGLGPLFNARSCQACHTKDGAARCRASIRWNGPTPWRCCCAWPFRKGRTVAIRGWGRMKSPPCPNPSTACSCRTSLAGLPAEGRMEIDYTPMVVLLNGGETATLMKPAYRIENPLRPDARRHADLAPPGAAHDRAGPARIHP